MGVRGNMTNNQTCKELKHARNGGRGKKNILYGIGNCSFTNSILISAKKRRKKIRVVVISNIDVQSEIDSIFNFFFFGNL